MENKYLIRGKSTKSEEYMYYCIDFQSGYPCWISSDAGAKQMGESALINTIEKVKNAFEGKSGVLYNQEIEENTLEYVKIAYVEPVRLSEITQEDIMWKQIEEQLTKEQLEFIKKSAKEAGNGD